MTTTKNRTTKQEKIEKVRDLIKGIKIADGLDESALIEFAEGLINNDSSKMGENETITLRK